MVEMDCTLEWVFRDVSEKVDWMIQVDISGHPPIPFEPPPLVLSVFQFLHNLLFLAVFRVLNFQSRFEALNEVFISKFVVLRYIFLTRY